MTNRQFARYNGTPDGDMPENDMPENDIPENDIPENDVPIMPMKKQAPMKKANGWRKSALSSVGKSKEGDILTLKDDLGYIQVAWKNVSADTGRNLVSVIKGSDATWRIRWFSDSNGVRRATEILTDEQYKAVSSAMWQNRKLMKHGYRTGNIWTA